MRARALLACVLLATAALTGCRRSSPASGRISQEEQGSLDPLAAPAVSPLPVPGFADAVVVAPTGATRPSRVIVAALGIGDTPEDQCNVWRELVENRAFVLCPRGVPHYVLDPSADPELGDAGPQVAQGYWYPDIGALEREVDASLRALEERHGRYVARRDAVYVGFSRGAFLGATFAAKHSARFSRVVLIEGGQSAWNDDLAGEFVRGGGKRILFVCGQPSCVGEAESAATILGRQHVETRIVHGEGEGHGYHHQVKEQIRGSLDWVTST